MNESKKKQPRFRVDKEFCAKHGISPNSMKNIIKKILNYDSISTWYDSAKSVKENLHYAEENSIETSRRTLYRYCEARRLNPKGTKPAEPKQPSKVSRATLYRYCKACGIDPKGTKPAESKQPSKKPQQANKNHKTKPESLYNIMNIKDKTIFVYDGLTYIFTNDPEPNKQIRGIFYTDTEEVRIYRDGTSSVHSLELQEASDSTLTI